MRPNLLQSSTWVSHLVGFVLFSFNMTRVFLKIRDRHRKLFAKLKLPILNSQYVTIDILNDDRFQFCNYVFNTR